MTISPAGFINTNKKAYEYVGLLLLFIGNP